MTPVPPDDTRRGYELLAQRIGFAILTFNCFWARPPSPGQPHPVGVAQYIDFSFLGNPAWHGALQFALVAALAVYALGILMPLAVGVLAFVWIGAGALYSSKGALGHSSQLVALVLLVQFLAYSQTFVARWWGRPASARDGHELSVWYTKQTIVAGYVIAGLSKLILSHGLWIVDAPNVALQIAKTHAQTYYTKLDASLLERGDAIAAVLLAHPHATRLLLGGSLLLELGTVLALVNRGFGIVVGLSLIAMHRGISYLMLLNFPEHEGLVLLYLIELPVLAIIGLGWLRDRTGYKLPSASMSTGSRRSSAPR